MRNDQYGPADCAAKGRGQAADVYTNADQHIHEHAGPANHYSDQHADRYSDQHSDQYTYQHTPNTATPTPSIGELTPGYWKNHLANSNSRGPWYSSECSTVSKIGGSCSLNGPWAIQYLPQLLGNYSVNNIITAAQIFKTMNCGSSKDQDAIGCLAGHLLATKMRKTHRPDAFQTSQ